MKIGDNVILISKEYNAPYFKEGKVIGERGESFLVKFYLEVDSDVEQDQWYELYIKLNDLKLVKD